MYKRAIQITNRNTTAILNLPCTKAVIKKDDRHGYEWLEYVIKGTQDRAEQGDWLCEDHAGNWHILTDDEYKTTYKTK